MNKNSVLSQKLAALGIAALCFGYFASYVPYSMMTKMITSGLFGGMEGVKFTGFHIAPVVTTGSFFCMYLYFTIAGWWKYSTHSKIFGLNIPRPQWYTLISGIGTGVVIVTTTLAYTFSGISIVFAMLLMRGGVLVLAPIVDLIARKRKRHIYWPSWLGAILSLGALVVAFAEKAGTAMTIVAAVDISFYLTAYFVRFVFMSNRAKSSDTDEKRRFFVEEQMVANPALFFGLLAVGFIGSHMAPESIPGQIWYGFSEFPFKGFLLEGLLIGMFSYGTGLFGSLILLDRREHTFSVAANRCSSIVAGVIATYLLALFYGERYPSVYEIAGVLLILGAIVFLSYRTIIEKREKVIAATPTVHQGPHDTSLQSLHLAEARARFASSQTEL